MYIILCIMPLLVQGYHAPNAFIAAEAPLRSTLTEFWTMIQGRKAAAVVLLCPLIENNEVRECT